MPGQLVNLDHHDGVIAWEVAYRLSAVSSKAESFKTMRNALMQPQLWRVMLSVESMANMDQEPVVITKQCCKI